MIVPYQNLSAEALRGLVEAFITREGTDYGAEEIALDVKVEQVMARIRTGEVVVVYDAGSETAGLALARELDGPTS